MPALLELACFHPQAAALAESWGVARIEFCAEALEGGTSPSAEDVDRVRESYSGSLGVMLRPRGGSFSYCEHEWSTMRTEVTRLANQGVDFVIVGALNKTNRLDERLQELSMLAESEGLKRVLHRAFDATADPLEAMEQAVEWGFDRILTGLGATTIETLQALKQAASGRIEVLAGGGIRAHNAQRYLEAGFDQIHSAALLDYRAEPPLPDRAETLAMLDLCRRY
jgi:copper homeostasis protein